MAYLDRTMPLAIKTVTSGFYRGFNPVVSIAAKVLVSCLVIGLIALHTGSENMLAVLKQMKLHHFGAWYIYLLAAFPVMCLGLALLPASGRIKLGQPGNSPKHSTKSWLAMMLCAGIGVMSDRVCSTFSARARDTVSQMPNPERRAGSRERWRSSRVRRWGSFCRAAPLSVSCR